MRFGPRRFSFRKRLAARTSWKRYIRHSLGLKAPRGWGWITNPRRAAYNRLYRRTTFDLFNRRRLSNSGCLVPLILFSGVISAMAYAWL